MLFSRGDDFLIFCGTWGPEGVRGVKLSPNFDSNFIFMLSLGYSIDPKIHSIYNSNISLSPF